MVEIQNLTVVFGDFIAVNRISMNLIPCEIFGFLGPNGAGKSTTIKVLTGQIQPTSGFVRVAGQDLIPSFKHLRALFGYVPDFDNHFEELSAFYNLKFFARLYDISPSKILETLDLVELRDAANIAVKNFSKGMKKKLAIAREILHSPKILYLDEPTANLDPHAKVKIRKLLCDLAARGATIFTTTHDMEEAEEICHRIAIIDHGKIVDIDTPAGFKTRFSDRLIHLIFQENGRDVQIDLDLSQPQAQKKLIETIESNTWLTLHSHETHLRDVFLRLTGHEFDLGPAPK